MGPVYFVSVMLASHAAEVTNTWSLSDAGHPLNYTLIDYRADGRAACQLRGVPRANNVETSTIPIYYFRFLSCHGSALAVAVCIPATNPSLDEGTLLLYVHSSLVWL